ncbi:MAG: biopolymer transporter ExbD [Deltaproteobacteria bacterium]|nr:biopolymer transporter ExbD [Deltaproteobacteria bacterium]MBW2137119.1 biopolymer transporter ExbD [Deltaproteobacteria bacterium]
MRFKKSKDEEPRLGIAPLIDIVFLLLIFFMVTSHFDVASGVRIRLPKVTKRIIDRSDNKITLVMDKEGSVYIEGKKIERGDLRTKLEAIIKERNLDRLVLQADKDVRHGRVVEVMDIAKSAGIDSVIIAAQWQGDRIL